MNEPTNEPTNEQIDESYEVERHRPRPDCYDDEEPEPRAEYALNLTPPTTVMVGSEAFIRASVVPPLGHVYISPIECPAASNITYWYGTSFRAEVPRKPDGTYQVWVASGTTTALFAVRLHGLPVGPHHITITVKSGGVIQSGSVDINVRYLCATHPRYGKWLATMQKVAPRWSDPNMVFAFGVENQVWYYDGSKVYFQVADYLNEPRYLDTAFNIARQYRDYVLANKAGIPGYRVFSRGLRMAYERSGDETYRNAVLHLANTMYALYGGSPYDSIIRETAYAINAHCEADRLGMPRSPMLARCVENLLTIFDTLFDGKKRYSLHQTFFDGLAMEALINYYELTGDRRMIAAVQACCDWMRAEAITAEGKLIINPEPKGPKCEWGCQQPNTDLINLTAPAFAWLWSVTGDERYRDSGDFLFQHSLDTDISYSGKIFSQNFKWSFSFLKYRDEVPLVTGSTGGGGGLS